MGNGTQITTSVTILNSMLGYIGISLTEFGTSAASNIATGSKIEVGGAFFTFTSDCIPNASSWTAITTSTTAYLALVPSGTAGSQILSASWQSSAPVWSTSKQGWYASAASVTRIVASAYKVGPTSYCNKALLSALVETSASLTKDGIIWVNGAYVKTNTAGSVIVTLSNNNAGATSQGPVLSFTNGSQSCYFEFYRTGTNVRGQIGALGNFEMNISYNMDYATSVHKYFTSSANACWFALNETGFYIQYAQSGYGGAGDIWDNTGNQYLIKVESANAGAYKGSLVTIPGECYATRGVTDRSYSFTTSNTSGDLFFWMDTRIAPTIGNTTRAGGNPGIYAAQRYSTSETRVLIYDGTYISGISGSASALTANFVLSV